MNKFGVCRYDINDYDPKVEDLIVFNTYEAAFAHYIGIITKDEHYPYTWDHDIHLVIIDGDNIVQFEELNVDKRSRFVSVEENTQDNNKEDVFFIDEDTDPELYQELLDCISNYKEQALSWGDIYYALCKMIQNVMYDIDNDMK